MHKASVAGAFCLWACFAAAFGGEADWAEFHGPRRDNICPETGLLKRWPEGGPRLLWTATPCGMGFSTVSVANGTIYTSGDVGDRTTIFAFDLDGKLKWKVENGASWKADPRQQWAVGNAGARATPTVNDGIVYQLNEMGRLGAFDPRDGREIWAVDLPERFAVPPPQWGYTESVFIDGDRLICYPGGPKGYMAALDKKSGRTVWANTDIREPASYCSVVPFECGGVRQFVTIAADSVIGVRADDGKLLWRHPFTNMRKINPVTPVVRDDRVFASTGYGAGSLMLKIVPDGAGLRAEKLWTSPAPDNHHGGVVLVDGRLYGSGNNAKGWTCLDFATGRVIYRDSPEGKGSVLYADGMLYCLDEKGTMELVEPGGTARKVVSSFKVPRGGKGLYWAHPVIHGGRLYLRHAERLFAYDIRAASPAPAR